MPATSKTGEVRNFGQNIVYRPTALHAPASEVEVLELLSRHRGRRVRVVGSLHSWSEAVRAEEMLLDLRELREVSVERDDRGPRAIVGAGCPIKQLLSELDRRGLTLPSIGLITEQTIAGAISTGTHGSGRECLSHFIDEVRLAGYDPSTGEPVVRVVDGGADLAAARCSLGGLGVILSVGVRCREAYRVEEHMRRYESVGEVLDAEERFPLQQFFLMPWTWDFYAQHRRETSAPRSRLASVYRLYWLALLDVGLHLLLCLAARWMKAPALKRALFRQVVPCVAVRGLRFVDDSRKMLVMHHHLFRHIEIEVFVPEDRLEQALELSRDILCSFGSQRREPGERTRGALEGLGLLEDLRRHAGTYDHHYPICVRKVLPDQTLISMGSADSAVYAISFISYQRPDDREAFLCFADLLARSAAALFGARPHWGKVCPLDSETLRSLYPRMPEFRAACLRHDRGGVFRNAWLDELLGLAQDREAAR